MAVLALGACKKDRSNPGLCTDAVVRWGGDPAVDGQGWILTDSINNAVYHADNLPDSLQLDGLPVRVCLLKTERIFYCQCTVSPNYYHITQIRKR